MFETQKPLRVVSVLDPAVDITAMGGDVVAEYMVTRNSELLQFVPGHKPAWFTIVPAQTNAYMQWMGSAEGDERARVAFQIGVRCVENLLDRNGNRIPRLEPTGSSGTVRYWTDSDLESIPPVFIKEIGEMADRCSFLAKTTDVGFPRPRWLLSELEASSLHRVVEEWRNARAANKELRAAQQTKQPDAGGEETTDATATERAT